MTAYIHIGTHKTGTTSIQSFLEINREFLLKQKIYCPRSCTMWNRVHHRMFKFILEEHCNTKTNNKNIVQNIKTTKYIQEFKKLKNEITENSGNNFLFSDEWFSWWFISKERVQIVKQFFNELGFDKIVLIIYLRNFQDFFNSLSSEDIKNKNLVFHTDLPANKNPNINAYNYSYICQNYSEIFGKENLIVRLFDKNEFYQGNLLKDFIHTIGIKWDNNFIILSNQNESLDLIGFELRYRINNLSISSDILLLDKLDNFFKSTNSYLRFKSKKEIMQSYIDYFEESNEWVRKEFFPHKERLFPKEDLSNYKENYELKEMKPEYWDKIAEFIADIVKTKNQVIADKTDIIQNKDKIIINQTIQVKSLQTTIKNNKAKLEKIINFKSIQLNQAQSKLFFQTKYSTAKARIQNQLSYKLGQAMIVNSKSILGYIRMPFVLSYIKDKHKQEQKIYREKIKKDPSLVLPPLEDYPDYKEALKEKECLTYKLGQALIQANKTWYKGGYAKLWFEIGKLKKEFGKA